MRGVEWQETAPTTTTMKMKMKIEYKERKEETLEKTLVGTLLGEFSDYDVKQAIVAEFGEGDYAYDVLDLVPVSRGYWEGTVHVYTAC